MQTEARARAIGGAASSLEPEVTSSSRRLSLPDGAVDRPSSMSAEEKRERAAQRRRRPNEAEARLWQRLEGRALDGFYFVREHEILGWWADFYCAAGRLVVEVDGRQHRDRRLEDNRRDEVMRANHYRVLRLPARLVFEDLDSALLSIQRALDNDWARRRRDRFASLHRSPHTKPTTDAVDDVPPALTRQKPRPLKRKFTCRRCDREFVIDVNAARWIECRSCLAADALAPVCRGCGTRVDKVADRSWYCAPCAEVRDVARRAAGSGETPTVSPPVED